MRQATAVEPETFGTSRPPAVPYRGRFRSQAVRHGFFAAAAFASNSFFPARRAFATLS